MAITKISIDNDCTTIKAYVCETTDPVYSYPTDCGSGSTMTVQNSRGLSVAFFKFDGTAWKPFAQELYLEDINNYDFLNYIRIDGDSTYVLNLEYKPIKNFSVRTDYDIPQVEYTTIVGTITKAGICTVTVTSALYQNPVVMNIAVDLGDTPSEVAEKIRNYISPILAGEYMVSGTDEDIYLTVLNPIAFDTTLNIAYTNGTCEGLTPDATSISLVGSQIESIEVEGVITTLGNATVIVTGADITGSPVSVTVAVAEADDASDVAGKMVTAINLNANISNKYVATSNGAMLILTRKVPTTNDITLNIAYENDTCVGLTEKTESENTADGQATNRKVLLANAPTRCKVEFEIDAVAVTPIEFINTVTWEVSAPVLTANTMTIVELRTIDGGDNWIGRILY